MVNTNLLRVGGIAGLLCVVVMIPAYLVGTPDRPYPALLTGPLLATLLALALGAPARSLLLWMLASASPFAE